MRSAAVTKGLWVAAGLFVLAVAFVLLLPYAASTQIVRDRIALELSAWSGYRVELGGAPQIAVWPTFRTELRDVRFSSWTDTERRPVMTVERLEADLSAMEALAGHVVFSNARLSRPTLHVDASGSTLSVPSPEGGRLSHSVELSRAVVTRDPGNPDRDALPDDPFGRVEFTEGRIVDPAGTEIGSGLAGSLDWPALNRGARLSVAGTWRGESVKASLSAARFLLLMGGGASDVEVAIESAPMRLTYKGLASLGSQGYVEGALSFATPSLTRMLDWSGQEVIGKGPGAVSVTASISGDARRLKFADADVVLDGNAGEGVLEVSFAGKVPSVSGTLAFGTLGFDSFVSVFARGGPADAGAMGSIFADRAAVDIRLSAASAAVGNLALTNVAATVQVREELAMFDISDATAFGGTVQAGVRFDRGAEGGQAELRLSAENLDGVTLASGVGWNWLVPAARGSISANLKGPARTWDELATRLSGTINVRFGNGSVAGFDLPQFLDRMRSSGFFSLADIGKGSVPMAGAEITATVGAGVARIDKAEIRTTDWVFALTGLVPYPGGGLALSGDALARREGDAATSWVPELGFFVGGSLRAPYVTAVPPDPLPE